MYLRNACIKCKIDIFQIYGVIGSIEQGKTHFTLVPDFPRFC